MDLARNLIQRVNLGDSLTRSAAARPDHPAVVDGDQRWTYAEFNAYVNRLAHGLTALGYTRADALGIASGNSAEFLALYYASPISARSALRLPACRSRSWGRTASCCRPANWARSSTGARPRCRAT